MLDGQPPQHDSGDSLGYSLDGARFTRTSIGYFRSDAPPYRALAPTGSPPGT